MEDRRKDTDRGNPKHSEKDMSLCLFVHHKYSMDWSAKETGPPL